MSPSTQTLFTPMRTRVTKVLGIIGVKPNMIVKETTAVSSAKAMTIIPKNACILRRLPLYTLFSTGFANLRFFPFRAIVVSMMQHFVAKMQQKQSNYHQIYANFGFQNWKRSFCTPLYLFSRASGLFPDLKNQITSLRVIISTCHHQIFLLLNNNMQVFGKFITPGREAWLTVRYWIWTNCFENSWVWWCHEPLSFNYGTFPPELGFL